MPRSGDEADPERAFAAALSLGCVAGADTAAAAIAMLRQSEVETYDGWREGLSLASSDEIDRLLVELVGSTSTSAAPASATTTASTSPAPTASSSSESAVVTAPFGADSGYAYKRDMSNAHVLANRASSAKFRLNQESRRRRRRALAVRRRSWFW